MLRRTFLAAGAIGLLSAAGFYAAPPVLQFRERLRQARAAAAQAPRYGQLGNGGAVLIVGDSTARGTGAGAAELSLAGRIGAALPDTRIVNYGENGARFADVVDQLLRAPPLPYRFVLVVAGSNDVLRLTPPRLVERDVQRVLELANRLSDEVVVMALPNIGHAPLLPWPLNEWYTRHARRVQTRVRAVADRQQVPLVNLYFEGLDDPFAREPDRYIAEDGMHPSAEGYGLWFEQLKTARPHLVEPPKPIHATRPNLRNNARPHRAVSGNGAR